MVKKCNNCGFQQNEFLKVGGKNYCNGCDALIEISSSQTTAQIQKTAHQLKLALGNLRLMLEPLEGYIEKAYNSYYPDFKNKRQLYGKTIQGDYPLDNFEETFLTQLLIMKGVCKGEPEFFRNEIKKEYYKWMELVGIDVRNCPEKLKHWLFEINEVLEDRGEKIVKEKEEKIKNIKFEPKDVVGLFRDLQNPLNKNREERENYKGKNWNELGNENRFGGNGEKGQQAFNQISQEISPKQSDFNFYPQQQTGQLMDNGNFAVIDNEVYLPVGPNEVNQSEYNVIQQDLRMPVNIPLNTPIVIGGGIAAATVGTIFSSARRYFKRSLA